MILYKCLYYFRGEFAWQTSFDGIDVFKYGFWLDKNFELTKGLDAKYWIPPSAIKYIEKESHETD
jgi:hypothetical protein